jgi:transcriptional regulator with XRE-family HTH domain
MGKVIRFPRRHARAPATSARRVASPAKTSSVISGLPFEAASLTIPDQCSPGIPRGRFFQPLTVEGDSLNASATPQVPPAASITVAQVQCESTIPLLVCVSRTRQALADCETTFRPLRGQISTMDSDKDIGRRIVALREHHQRAGAEEARSQAEFANSISVANNTLSEYESGKKHLPLEKARRICARWGASLDWLINGSVGQPGYELAVKLGPRPKIRARLRLMTRSRSRSVCITTTSSTG